MFSIAGRAGIDCEVQDFSDSNNNLQYNFVLYGSLEARYYFTLRRRLRKGKSVRNFSGPYLSVEQNIFTNPFLLINQPRKDAFDGSTRTFLNAGYQRQFGKFYIRIAMGVAL